MEINTGPSAAPHTNPITDSKPLVSRVKDLLLQPKAEWERIDAESATIGGIYTSYVAILAAIPAVATAVGYAVFGMPAFFVTVRPGMGWILGNAITSYVMTLAMVYVLALLIEALAPNFGGTKDRLKAFKVAAYAGTAGWVAGALSIIPQLGMIAGLVGGIYSLYLLYLGLPRLMRVPQEKAVAYIGLVILAAIVLFIVVGMVVGSVASIF